MNRSLLNLLTWATLAAAVLSAGLVAFGEANGLGERGRMMLRLPEEAPSAGPRRMPGEPSAGEPTPGASAARPPHAPRRG